MEPATYLMDYPLFVFPLCFTALWLSAQGGIYLRKTRENLVEFQRQDLGLVLGATLTLLGLVIGFSFSMATGRYDQRKYYEELEANAIGTEYVRLNLLSAADAAQARILLKHYLDQRVLFYVTRNLDSLRRVDASTSRLQNDLWSSVVVPCSQRPTAVAALILAGMNDVLNSQSFTQAAWWNRIPAGAWILMFAIALFCNMLFGYIAHLENRALLFFAMPMIVSVAFFLLSDLDSPRNGVIRVQPQNLVNLSVSLRAQ